MLTSRFIKTTALLLSFGGISQAQLKWEQREIVSTAVPTANDISANFAFTNTGRHPVTITAVETSCECTTAKPDKQTYAPGESGKLVAKFTIGQRLGEQSKTIVVTTDDSKEKTILLRLKVTIPILFEAAPKLAVWTVGEPPTPKELTIKVVADEPISLKTAMPIGNGVTAELKSIVDGREYRVVLTPTATTRPTTEAIDVLADLENGRNKIRVFAAVKASDAHKP